MFTYVQHTPDDSNVKKTGNFQFQNIVPSNNGSCSACLDVHGMYDIYAFSPVRLSICMFANIFILVEKLKNALTSQF